MDALLIGVLIINVVLKIISLPPFKTRIRFKKQTYHSSNHHLLTKILTDLFKVFKKGSEEFGNQRDRFRLSLESPVDDQLGTLERFNKQFALKESEREAVAWAWPQEAGDTMFHLVNTYTRAAAMEGLLAESGYRLQKVGGEVLEMMN